MAWVTYSSSFGPRDVEHHARFARLAHLPLLLLTCCWVEWIDLNCAHEEG